MDVFSFMFLSLYPVNGYLACWTEAGWGAELVFDGQKKNMCFAGDRTPVLHIATVLI